jgi:hypothetical protein
MKTTPSPLPDFITGYRQRPYTNIYEICPEERLLFGTETLYGDWDAELLILGQDAGPADEFERLRDSGHPHPFAHREFRPGFPRYDPAAGRGGAGTNATVYTLAELVDCRKLYGSAMIGMLRPGQNYHGTLPKPSLVREHCVKVLRWVIDPARMSNLAAIMCLGSIAHDFASRALVSGPPLKSPPRLFRTPHPAAHAQAGSVRNVLPAWQAIAHQMGWSWKGD